MISGIRSGYAGFLYNAALSARPERLVGDVAETEQSNAVRRKPAVSDGKAPFQAGVFGSNSVTQSGAVVYEPSGLLADLSGSGRAEKASFDLRTISPASAYRQHAPQEVPTEEGLQKEPVNYTFEIIV